MFKRKSILFVNPDYHCSFILRDELRRLGWRADVFISIYYPEKLLYKSDGIKFDSIKYINNKVLRYILLFFILTFFLPISLLKWKYFLFYGSMDIFILPWDRFIARILNTEFRTFLAVCRLFGKKILYLPSGCLDEELQSNFVIFY